MHQTKHTGRLACLLTASLVALVTTANALPFVYQYGDLALGFRKTGTYTGNYECVADIGPGINYVNLPAGATTNITGYTATQIVPNSFPNFTNLSWSVCGYVVSKNYFPGYPANTIWAAVPRSVTGVPGSPPNRLSAKPQGYTSLQIEGIFLGAAQLSSQLSAGQDNTATFVQEPYSIANNQNYGYYMADPGIPSYADLGGTGPEDTNGNLINLEFTTVAPFATAAIADLYEIRPIANVDPNTGQSSGLAYNVGYFTFNPNGSMTFTRATSGVTAPLAAFAGTPTNGSAPLKVTFSDASTGTITNWLWNFGDGHTYTNAVSGSTSHTYTNAGSYTVSLMTAGPGGTSTSTSNNYVVVTAAVIAPVAAFTGSPTTGFAPLKVILADASTGTITNWLWNFGNGHTVTDTVSGSVTNIYTTTGNFTVSLTTTGPGGANTVTKANFVVISPAPHFSSSALVGNSFIMSGTNGPAGVQYRVLSTTNLTSALVNWTSVYTNIFSPTGAFGYTNTTGKTKSFFTLVSP